MKTAIITGASGQDGSYLCEFLEEKGYRVVKFRGDVTNYNEIYETIKHYNPDEIYNLAAKIHYDSPTKTFNVNTMGILNIIEAVKGVGTRSRCKIFQASSSEIFANTKSTWSTPQTIHTMRGPRGIYGISKESADSLVKHYRENEGIFVCSGILYNHESPRRPGIYVTQKIIQGLQSGECFQIGNLESRRDWGHAKDYVKAMWLMLQQQWAMDFIIASGKPYSVREFIEIAVKKMNKTIEWSEEGVNEVGVIDGKTVVKVSDEFYQPNNNILLVGDSDPIEKLGWTREYDIESLIEEMLSPPIEK
jgi:GDPmannose 4,6-dehydratase